MARGFDPLCHSRVVGNPVTAGTLDARLRGHDTAKLVACVVLCFAFGACAAAAEFTFAALGDTPYHADEEARFTAMIAELNRNDLAFVVHAGDFKSGSSDCSDELYRERKEWFGLSHHPWIYVPGDNDWTDCWRPLAGAYQPIERLNKLRELFFAQPRSLGQRPIELEQQTRGASPRPYPEHARWVHRRVLFVTINVPGGDNNRGRDRAEFRVRDAAIRRWIEESFGRARAQRLAGVVIVMQANPWAAAGERQRGYAPLLDALRTQTTGFPGEVLLIHGDTHRFRVDQPLVDTDTGQRIANFTRIEVFGSPNVNWARVRVHETGSGVKFSAEPGS
jgi:hypothetical protein